MLARLVKYLVIKPKKFEYAHAHPMWQQLQICSQASTQHPDLVDSLIFDEPT